MLAFASKYQDGPVAIRYPRLDRKPGRLPLTDSCRAGLKHSTREKTSPLSLTAVPEW